MSQVRLAQYDPEDVLDESVLWTESYDVGDGIRCIRMVNSIYLNLDALGGTEENRVKDRRRRPEGVNGSQSKFLTGTWPMS
jgi:hypothetical protein